MDNKEVIGPRELWRTDRPVTRDSDEPQWEEPERVKASHENATLVSSSLGLPGMRVHMPVLDLDVPAFLVPSSTPGHNHLYINHAVPEARYFDLLDVMGELGILQPNYVRHSVNRDATMVRYPGVTKDNEAQYIRDTRPPKRWDTR